MTQERPRFSLDDLDRDIEYPREKPDKERDDFQYLMKIFIYYPILMNKQRTKPDKTVITFPPDE